MSHQLQVSIDSQLAVSSVIRALEAEGLRVYQSFDLRSVLVALPDCGCLHHGTDQCNCQYAVLLVYGNAPPPVQVVAHGRDGQTWLSVVGADAAPSALQQRIVEILKDTFAQEPPGDGCPPSEGAAGSDLPGPVGSSGNHPPLSTGSERQQSGEHRD